MKHVLIALAVIFVAVSAQAADVGVSITVGQPGFYGHIDIGNYPKPEVVYAKPIVVQPPRGRVAEEPIYLRVPPGHQKNWGKHCQRYNACGKPVYFVKDKWYNEVYVPQYQQHRMRDGKGQPGHGPGPGQRDDRGYERDRGHDKGPGPGAGQGRGRGHDRD